MFVFIIADGISEMIGWRFYVIKKEMFAHDSSLYNMPSTCQIEIILLFRSAILRHKHHIWIWWRPLDWMQSAKSPSALSAIVCSNLEHKSQVDTTSVRETGNGSGRGK